MEQISGRGIVDEEYISRMSVEQLRYELVEALEFQFAFLDALRTLPAMPPSFILRQLGAAATWPDHHELGKTLQKTHSLEEIPPVSECEGGAGLWSLIRKALTKSTDN